MLAVFSACSWMISRKPSRPATSILSKVTGVRKAGWYLARARNSAVLVEDPSQSAGHARAEVLARAAEHHHQAASHVLTAVVADTLDDGKSSELRTAKRSPARPAAKSAPAVAP